MRPRGRGGPPVSVSVLLVLAGLLWLHVPTLAAHQILWGRCYSYCIQKHLLGDDRSSDDVAVRTLPKHPIRACQRHAICKWCLYVCERPEENFTNSETCRRDCARTRTQRRSGERQACTDACGFVGRASSAKGGTCPAPISLSGFKSACVTSCHGDRDCDKAEEKCCDNGCGSVCTAPYDVHILPPVPSNISFKLLPTGGVLVKWGPQDSDDKRRSDKQGGRTGSSREGGERGDSPVVYILRWWCPYTSGAITAVTDRARTQLQGYPTGIYPGSKCHFMVAAVNIHGSRGFSKVSPYIKKFLLPSAPLHLDKAKSTLNDGKVDVTIQWQPPIYTDGLPVYRYQVFWSDSLPKASPSYMRLHMNKRTLTADKHSFVLRSLEPGTIYFVQVRAVVRWKRKQKRGELASTYIETYSPPQQAKNNEAMDIMPEYDPSVEGAIYNLTVNQTFFHNTILKTAITWTLKPGKSARKYLIYWRLEACARNEHRKAHHRLETSATSHERSFTLYNLQPDCEYAVRVHPVNRRGRTGTATVTSFLTPPCHMVEVVQGDPPICHTDDPPGQVKGLHSETSGCITVVRWEPSSAEQGGQVDSYDVMWGETEAGAFSTATIIYTSAPHQLTLPANTTHVHLGQLTGGQHYSVQVSASSVGGSSLPAILHFTTPLLQQPCRPQTATSGSVGSSRQLFTSTVTSHKNSSDVSDTVSLSSTDDKVTRNTSLFVSADSATGDLSGNKTRDVSVELDVMGGENCCNKSTIHEAGDHSEADGFMGGKALLPAPTPSPSTSPRFSTKDFSGTAPHGVTGHPAGETGVRVNTRTSQPSGTPQPRDQQNSLNTQVSATGPRATSAGGTVNTTQAAGRDSEVNVTDFSAQPSGGVTDIGVKGAGAGLQTSLQTVAACLLLVCWGSACLLR